MHLLRPSKDNNICIMSSDQRFDSLLKHPDFLKLWAAQIGSAFGSRITRTVLPMIAILTINATPNEIAILSALGFAPGLLVAFFAGGHIDRNKRRPLLIATDLIRAALIFSVPLAAYFSTMSMMQLYVVAAIVGAATSIFQIADNAYLPRLVEKDQLVDANSKLEASDAVAEASGPGIAGLLVSLFSAPVAMIFDAVTYLWSALMLSFIKKPEPEPAKRTAEDSLLKDAILGFMSCAKHPIVGPILAAEILMTLAGGIYVTLYMVLALRTLALDPLTIGLIISLGGIAGFFGAMVAKPVADKLGLRNTLIITALLGQLADFAIPFAAAFPQHGIALLSLQQIAGDFFMTIFVIQAISLRQREMPDHVLARANATFQLLTGMAIPFSALMAGPISMWIGITNTLWIAAIGGVLALPVLLLIKSAPKST